MVSTSRTTWRSAGDVSAPELTMPEPTPTGDRADDAQHATAYEQYASYEDGEATIICDRKQPQAWIRSDTVVRVHR